MPPSDDESFVPNAEELLANNARYAEHFDDDNLAVQPRRRMAIVACMDSRMDIFQMLGLAHGDAHIIRNAGGIVTDELEFIENSVLGFLFPMMKKYVLEELG